MPSRCAPGGYIYHVLNRAIPSAVLFETPEDYRAFERMIAQACEHVPMRILAYCLMPNHWHFVLWPYKDGDLAKFMHWLTSTHSHLWRSIRDTVGRGHLYQSRYKSFPVKDDFHLLRLCRYVERNARRANLVRRAEHWRWGSLWRRLHADITDGLPPLSDWPLGRPDNWIEIVNEPQTQAEIKAIRMSIARNRPLGSTAWQEQVAKALGIEHTLKPRGRPHGS